MTVERDVDYLVIGAGVTGLAFGNAVLEEHKSAGLPQPRVLVLEADAEPGGYCKTVVQDGFVWDYSGHFFHFRHPEIESWLRARMPGQDIRTVDKCALIRFKGQDIDFPFQKNIHQLDRDDFIDCLVSLYFRDQENPGAEDSFASMLYKRFGRGIADRFLIPYNEKLYACKLDELDRDAMGRFFPHADIADIVRNMRDPDNTSYNQSFTYPAGGAIEYINALLVDVPAHAVECGQRVTSIQLGARTATTDDGATIRFRQLISSAPLPSLLSMCGMEFDEKAFSWNKVLVFNFGFDRKGARDVHWMYFPEREYRFYRVGFYDNIMGSDRMSLYVEIGSHRDEELDVASERSRVLRDLSTAGIVDDHELVSEHWVCLDPAYVHITRGGQREAARLRETLTESGVSSIGRYGGWTYCSIEDNIVEARALARRLTTA